MKCSKILILFIVLFGNSISYQQDYDWSPIDQIIEQQIQAKTFPGAVAFIGNKNGVLYSNAYGSFTYGEPSPVNGDNPPMTIETLFDMASLTKVTMTTTAIMTFYQRGELDLHMPVSSSYLLGSSFSQNGKETITTLNLLLHNAGYPPDPIPGYSETSFGCPQSFYYYPPLSFACQDKIYESLLAQTLVNPVGKYFVYSDLSMITGMYVVGKLAKSLGYISSSDLLLGCDQGGPGNLQCYYEAYVREYVLNPLNMSSSGFLPLKSTWGNIAPTWNDTYFRHEILQGVVSDENSYTLGGISGHAGFFSCVEDVWNLVQWLINPEELNPIKINTTTIQFFTTEYNHTQSSRALGWDTNDINNSYDPCGEMSTKTFTHTGYTGTEICCDPTLGICSVLLTNRVYPCEACNMDTIQQARQQFNTEIKNILTSKK